MLNNFRQSYVVLLRYPTFARFWGAKLFSLFGDAMTFIALPWFVFQLTGSGTTTAAVMLSLQLPALASGMIIGSLLDRFQPRLVMALDNALRTLLVALIPLLYWLERLDLWSLFVITILIGLLQPATLVGSRVILPDLVANQDLDSANMLWAFSANLSIVIGPAVAGILVALYGGPFVLLIDAGTFALMAVVARTLPRLTRTSPLAHIPLAERLGLRQLWQVKVVRITTLLSLVFFFSYGPLEAALPSYSATILQTDARGYGLLWTALGVGALLGTVGSTLVGRYLRLGLALPLIALLWGATLLPLLFVHELWLACLLFALGGLIWGPYTPMETTLLQRTVPKEQLGRVFGARSTLLTSGSPLGIATGGLLLAFIPPSVVIALSGLACVIVGICGLVSPALRTLVLPLVPGERPSG